jgi:hypothetical protein
VEDREEAVVGVVSACFGVVEVQGSGLGVGQRQTVSV